VAKLVCKNGNIEPQIVDWPSKSEHWKSVAAFRQMRSLPRTNFCTDGAPIACCCCLNNYTLLPQ
jgi:hypothetical protein